MTRQVSWTNLPVVMLKAVSIKKPPVKGGFEDRRRWGLFFVAVIALGRPAVFFVAVFADSAVRRVFVDNDLGRGTFMACRAVHLLAVDFVIEGDRALRALISHGVGGVGHSEGESDQHHSNYQFFHSSLLVCWWLIINKG
jgi:hypothetical protein